MSRLPSRLPPIGPGKARWKAHHNASRRAVMIRSHGRCESCKKVSRRLEWAHLFSRGFIVAEPYCSSPELTMALCAYDPMTNQIGCHERIDRHLDNALRDRLQLVAAQRFYEKYKGKYPKSLNPAGAVRKLAARLEKDGVGLEPSYRWQDISLKSESWLERPV